MDYDIDEEDQDIELKFFLFIEGMEVLNIFLIDFEIYVRLEVLFEVVGKDYCRLLLICNGILICLLILL